MSPATYAEAIAAIANDPLAYLDFPESLCSREIRRAALARNGLLLQTLSWRDRTAEMCLAALSQSARAAPFVPKTLADDPAVVAALAAAPKPTRPSLKPQLASYAANTEVAWIELDGGDTLANTEHPYRPVGQYFVDLAGKPAANISRAHALDLVEPAALSYELAFAHEPPQERQARIAIWTVDDHIVVSCAPITQIPPALRVAGLEAVLASAYRAVTGENPPLEAPSKAPFEEYWGD
jgi:hypothetical protein